MLTPILFYFLFIPEGRYAKVFYYPLETKMCNALDVYPNARLFRVCSTNEKKLELEDVTAVTKEECTK